MRIFYLAYAGTVSHDKLKQLASQGGAAALFSGNAPQGALALITQKLGATTDLSAAFARRHAELASAIVAGCGWLGIDRDSLPDRMAFIRAATSCPLWLPPAVLTPLPSTKERRTGSPVLATQGSVGQKAAVTFGNLADSGTALRAARKARRQELAQEAESFQSPLFEL